MKKFYLICLLAVSLMTSSSQTHAAMVMVEVEDNEFNPSIFTVNVGDTIMWYWHNPAGYHTITSTTIPSGAAAWNEMIDPTHIAYSYVVTVPGSYDYICIYHSSMGMVGHFTAVGTTTGINEETIPSISFINNYISNGNLNVDYALPASTMLNIELYDVIGNKVKTLISNNQASGRHSENFDVAELPKGIYILQLATADARLSRRIYKQ